MWRPLTPEQVSVTVTEEGNRLLVRWRGAAFEELRASFRAHFRTHHDAVYNGSLKAWSLPLAARYRLQDWLAQTCLPGAITWVNEPGGGTTHASGQSSYHRYQHQGTVTPPLEQALAVLHLRPTAPLELVQAARRILIKAHHPDRGGQHSAAVAINAAADVIETYHERRSS